MRNHIKRTLLLASVAILPLTAACNDKEEAKTSAVTAPTSDQDVPGTPVRPGKPGQKPGQPSGANKPAGVPAADIARYKALATCVRSNGINVPEPEAGKPWDTSAVDSAGLTPEWSKVLGACPDYKKLVIGVG